MSVNPSFELFEEICTELSGQEEAVLIDDDFAPDTVERLKRWYKEPGTTAAIAKGLDYLRKHFEARGSALPFSYELGTGRVVSLDRDYIDFVSDAQDKRRIAAESKRFELATSKHLASRLTGLVNRVGSPRTRHRDRKQFTAYLVKHMHFDKRVLIGNDKDGGFDILWFPPLGAFPFRAIVSIQCKNSFYNRDAGFKSVGRAKQSLGRHAYARAEDVHLHYVVYNDYIDERAVENARGVCFVPLGLSDLAPLRAPFSVLEQL